MILICVFSACRAHVTSQQSTFVWFKAAEGTFRASQQKYANERAEYSWMMTRHSYLSSGRKRKANRMDCVITVLNLITVFRK